MISVFKRVNFKRYLMYLLRWQLSTPILAIVLIWFASVNQWIATVVANLIGGLIFFWIDMFIFTSDSLAAQWEVKEKVKCVDCGRLSRGYRLVKAPNYNRLKDKKPEFRCESCSMEKTEKLRESGIKI